MAKIVDARPAAVPKIELRLSQPDLLAYICEVVASAAIAKTMPLAGQEECSRPAPEQPVTFAAVAFEPMHDTPVQRQQSLLADFALPDVKNAEFNIEIGRIKTESFADPKPGHGDQAEERRAGEATQAVDRWQRPRLLDDRNNFGFTVDIWVHALKVTGHYPRGGASCLGSMPCNHPQIGGPP